MPYGLSKEDPATRKVKKGKSLPGTRRRAPSGMIARKNASILLLRGLLVCQGGIAPCKKRGAASKKVPPPDSSGGKDVGKKRRKPCRGKSRRLGSGFFPSQKPSIAWDEKRGPPPPISGGKRRWEGRQGGAEPKKSGGSSFCSDKRSHLRDKEGDTWIALNEKKGAFRDWNRPEPGHIKKINSISNLKSPFKEGGVGKCSRRERGA